MSNDFNFRGLSILLYWSYLKENVIDLYVMLLLMIILESGGMRL